MVKESKPKNKTHNPKENTYSIWPFYFFRILFMGAREPRRKLKGLSIGPRTEDEVERLQH